MLSKASGSCVRTWKGNSSGKTKRTHFQEPRGLVQGFVLMTRDSRGVPLLRGSRCTPRCSLRGALGFIHWESACKALAGKVTQGGNIPTGIWLLLQAPGQAVVLLLHSQILTVYRQYYRPPPVGLKWPMPEASAGNGCTKSD